MRTLLTTLLIACSAWVAAQTTLIEAFRASYTQEQGGNYQAAVHALLEVYETSSYETNLRLGWLYYTMGQYPSSQQYYQRACDLMPYAIEPKLGLTYPLGALGNWSAVIAQYEKVLSIDPQNTKAKYNLAAIYYERKDYRKAQDYIEDVVNLYPFDYDSLVLFAWIQYQMGNLAKAKVLFQKALLYNPDGLSALTGLDSIAQ